MSKICDNKTRKKYYVLTKTKGSMKTTTEFSLISKKLSI